MVQFFCQRGGFQCYGSCLAMLQSLNLSEKQLIIPFINTGWNILVENEPFSFSFSLTHGTNQCSLINNWVPHHSSVFCPFELRLYRCTQSRLCCSTGPFTGLNSVRSWTPLSVLSAALPEYTKIQQTLVFSVSLCQCRLPVESSCCIFKKMFHSPLFFQLIEEPC